MHLLPSAGYSVPLQMCKYKSEINKPGGYWKEMLSAYYIENMNLISQYLELLSLQYTFYT